jgi:hypothetical protein
VLPFPQLIIEQVNIVRDAVLIQQLIELLVVDAMRPFHFPVQMRLRATFPSAPACRNTFNRQLSKRVCSVFVIGSPLYERRTEAVTLVLGFHKATCASC